MNLFGGIGGDANWFLNRNMNKVNNLVLNVCSGLIKIGNRIFPVDKKSGECDYYSYNNVSFAYENSGDYFVKKAGDNPIINNGIDSFVCINESEKLDAYSGEFKSYSLKDVRKSINLSQDELNWINKKVEFADYLNIEKNNINDFLMNGVYENNLNIDNSTYLDDSVIMCSPFLFLGTCININDEYIRVNGCLTENPLFCNLGVMCEFNVNCVFKLLSYASSVFDDISISYCSRKIGGHKKYVGSLANLTMFVRFKNIWFLVSFDLVEIFRQFVDFVRELSNDFDKKNVELDIKMPSLSYFKKSILLARRYIKAFLMILRSFAIGYEVLNEWMSVVNKLTVDLSSCSVGISAYATLN